MYLKLKGNVNKIILLTPKIDGSQSVSVECGISDGYVSVYYYYWCNAVVITNYDVGNS